MKKESQKARNEDEFKTSPLSRNRRKIPVERTRGVGEVAVAERF